MENQAQKQTGAKAGVRGRLSHRTCRRNELEHIPLCISIQKSGGRESSWPSQCTSSPWPWGSGHSTVMDSTAETTRRKRVIPTPGPPKPPFLGNSQQLPELHSENA